MVTRSARQVLSHQFKIAAKLELFVGSCPDGEKQVYQKCRFKRLGYLSLDNNERSNWQARELKSVQLDAYGRFVKIVCHACHSNRLNMYSQVGLIAINVIGDAAPAGAAGGGLLAGAGAGAVYSSVAQGGAGGKGQLSALDDLTFDLNFDPRTAAQIRELHLAKERAVQAEDYDAAKRLKDAIDKLKQVGAKMAKLELRKKAAVENEDYDTAKMIKVEMDKLRYNVALGPAAPGAPAQQPDDYGGRHQPVALVDAGPRAEPEPVVRNPFSKVPGAALPSSSPPPAHHGAYGGGVHLAAPSSSPGQHRGSAHTMSPGDAAAPRSSPAHASPARSGASGATPMRGDGASSGGGGGGGGYLGAAASPAAYSPSGGGGGDGGGGGGGYAGSEAGERRGAPGEGEYAPEGGGDPSGIVSGPRRIIDPDVRQIRSKDPGQGGDVREEDLAAMGDKAAEAANNAQVGPVEEVPAALALEAEAIAAAFGPDTARQVLSRTWQHREAGIGAMLEALAQPQPDPGRSVKAVSTALSRVLADKNPSVYLAALRLLVVLLDMRDEGGRPVDSRGVVDACVAAMVARLAETNARLKDETAKVLLDLAERPGAGGCAAVAAAILKLPKQGGHVWRVVLARLEFLDTLMDKHEPAPENGLSLNAVSPIVTIGLNSSNNLTRAKATAVLRRLHDLHGYHKVLPIMRGIESSATFNQIQKEVGGPPPVAAAPPPAPGRKPKLDGAPAGKRPVHPSPAKPHKSPALHKKGGAAGGAAEREPVDDKEKVAWYQRRAESGDADAQYNLGCCFDEGRGVAADHAQAAHWYDKAAAQGDPDAKFALGVCLHDGKGVDKDVKRAVALWEEAAEAGQEDAKFLLGQSANPPDDA
jgi:centrosomal protein CEP104